MGYDKYGLLSNYTKCQRTGLKGTKLQPHKKGLNARLNVLNAGPHRLQLYNYVNASKVRTPGYRGPLHKGGLTAGLIKGLNAGTSLLLTARNMRTPR